MIHPPIIRSLLLLLTVSSPAIAEAFRSGHLGVMDYYRMENVKADTQMRGNIAKGEQ